MSYRDDNAPHAREEKATAGSLPRLVWDNWSDLLADCETYHERKPGADGGSLADGDEWAGSGTWTGTLEHARYGWTDGRKYAMEQLAMDMNFAQPQPAPARGYGMAGRRPSVSRYISGNPRNMVTRGVDVMGGAPIVRIVANVTISAGVEWECLARRGAALAVAIDQLEQAGAQCEISVCWCTGDASEVFATFKRAGEPLDIDRLTFALASPECSRRLMFMAKQMAGGSHGNPSDPNLGEGAERILYLPAMTYDDPDYETPEKALAATERLLREGLGDELVEKLTGAAA